jgi:hypothetical protein
MTYTSILYWPEEVSLCSYDNSSDDTHIDEAGAISVCKTLIMKGFGCNRQHYPVRAIAKSGDDVIFEWNNVDGIITEKREVYNYCEEARKKLRERYPANYKPEFLR